MKLLLALLLSTLALAAPACSHKDATPANELEWPLPGSDSMASVGAGLGRGAGGTTAIWRRLTTYGGSFLKSWRRALEAADEPAVGDVLDAFNELAFAVTGPAGFWRKTLPGKWLGCESTPESDPCKRIATLQQELEQWDTVQKQISELPPERVASFLQKNEARILGYLDTYVPNEPSADAMKATPFYRKNLAAVLETWSGGGTNNGDL